MTPRPGRALLGMDATGPIIARMARRLSSPIFVGRSEELNTLLSTADVAASGQASLVLIGGEAGVGKSRLVAEAASQLRDRGWLVLEGGSVALGDDGTGAGGLHPPLRPRTHPVADPERRMIRHG